jgi:hypothetical protein
MRADDPTLSMVAIRRRLVSLSGASVSMTVQRTLELVDFGDELKYFGGNGDVLDFVHAQYPFSPIYSQFARDIHFYPFSPVCDGISELHRFIPQDDPTHHDFFRIGQEVAV